MWLGCSRNRTQGMSKKFAVTIVIDPIWRVPRKASAYCCTSAHLAAHQLIAGFRLLTRTLSGYVEHEVVGQFEISATISSTDHT